MYLERPGHVILHQYYIFVKDDEQKIIFIPTSITLVYEAGNSFIYV